MDAPTPFKLIAPDQLRIKEGGGCMALFGIPFFIAGVFVTLIGARLIRVENAAQIPPWGWPLIVLMGLVFVAVGGGLVFGRRWMTIDRGRGLIHKQWGLLVPMRGEEHSLQGFCSVVIGFDAGDSDTADRYPVLLRAQDGQEDLTVSSSTDYQESRNRAVFLAKFLNFPLVDASTEHETFFAAGSVDESFQQRLRSQRDRLDAAVRPVVMQSQVSEAATQVQIVIPGPGFSRRKLLGLAIPAGTFAYVLPQLLRFFRQTETPEFVQLFFVGFALLFLVVIPLLNILHAFIQAKRSCTTITATADGIEIEERGAWKSKRTSIPAAEVLDLDYHTAQGQMSSAWTSASRRARRSGGTDWQPTGDPDIKPWWYRRLSQLAKSKGVMVKSTRGMITFGAGLADDEVRHLHSIVTAALAGRQPR